MLAGWTQDEVRNAIVEYVKFTRDEASGSGRRFEECFRPLCSIIVELLRKTRDGFDHDEEHWARDVVPDRFLRKPEDPQSKADDDLAVIEARQTGDDKLAEDALPSKTAKNSIKAPDRTIVEGIDIWV